MDFFLFFPPKEKCRPLVCTDFRKLKELITRKPFLLPLIWDLITSIPARVKFSSILDLNMGYYQLSLVKDTSDMCTMVLPWGKYSYAGLPMGVLGSLDIFQQVVGGLFQDMV